MLREIERRLGLAERLAGCLKDPRMPEKVVHRLAEIIRFRMLMIAAGYEDGNDADPLRGDPEMVWGERRGNGTIVAVTTDGVPHTTVE